MILIIFSLMVIMVSSIDFTIQYDKKDVLKFMPSNEELKMKILASEWKWYEGQYEVDKIKKTKTPKFTVDENGKIEMVWPPNTEQWTMMETPIEKIIPKDKPPKKFLLSDRDALKFIGSELSTQPRWQFVESGSSSHYIHSYYTAGKKNNAHNLLQDYLTKKGYLELYNMNARVKPEDKGVWIFTKQDLKLKALAHVAYYDNYAAYEQYVENEQEIALLKQEETELKAIENLRLRRKRNRLRRKRRKYGY